MKFTQTGWLFVMIATVTLTHAQPDLPPLLEEVVLARAGVEQTAGAVPLEIDPAAYEKLWRLGAARVVGLPLPGGEQVDLEVVSYNLLSPGAKFFVHGEAGLRETAPPEMRFYRGRIAGEPDSLVALTLFGGRIAGNIRSGSNGWAFAPRDFSPDREGSHDVRIWRRDDEAGPQGRCDGHKTPARSHQVETGVLSLTGPAPAPLIDGNTLLKAKIAIEGTVEWTTKHGGVTGAQAYTLNLMAQVSAIFEADVKVQLEVPYVLMNSAESDGYSGGANDASTILNEMVAKWNASPTLQAVFRTSAHVFSTFPSGGSGIAYLDVLCDNVPVDPAAVDFGVSLLEGNAGSWESILTAHELGHNFSSPHTHCYLPPIDQCFNAEPGCYAGPEVQTTGTIMSYCNTRNAVFDQRCIDETLRPAAEAAFPTCIDVAGSPGEIRPQDGSSLQVSPANICGSATLANDDGSSNGNFGLNGTAQAAWVKRFTPPCYPFKLTRVDVQIGHTSVAMGRPVRVLVYTDPTGSGNPANASLAHAQDTTVQVVSSSVFNEFTLTTPTIVTSGDFYLGLYDLLADAGTTFIMRYDSSHTGDSWFQANSTTPSGYGPFGSGSWMIRGQGGGVVVGSQQLTWGTPCNDVGVPDQDYAVYQGTIGSWSGLTSLACTTGRNTTWLAEGPPASVFWIVVPQTSANEGSYGQATSGQRAPAAIPCKPQSIGSCE